MTKWDLSLGCKDGSAYQINKCDISSVQFSHSVMSDSATPWTAACQTSLSITNSQSLLKLMPIESMMPSNHLILCHPLLLRLQSFPASGSFPVSQFYTPGGQSTGASASALVLPMNIQRWFPLGWTGLIFSLFKSTTFGKHQFFSAHSSLCSNSHIDTLLLKKS